MSDYESGYSVGKACGHAIHEADAMQAGIEASDSAEHARGFRDGYLDGWDAWKQECDWMQQGRLDLVHQSWDTRRGPRFKSPESEQTA